MKSKFHLTHYASLWLVLMLGLFCLVWFRYNHSLQFTVVIIMALYYPLWGAIHHHGQQDLHPKIVVEYALLALLAILFVGSVLLWG